MVNCLVKILTDVIEKVTKHATQITAFEKEFESEKSKTEKLVGELLGKYEELQNQTKNENDNTDRLVKEKTDILEKEFDKKVDDLDKKFDEARQREMKGTLSSPNRTCNPLWQCLKLETGLKPTLMNMSLKWRWF